MWVLGATSPVTGHYWPIVMPAPRSTLSKSMISKVRAQIGTSNVENYRPNSLIHSNSLIHLYLRSSAVSDSLAGNFCTSQDLPGLRGFLQSRGGPHTGDASVVHKTPMILFSFMFPTKKVTGFLPSDCRSLTVNTIKSPSLWPKSIASSSSSSPLLSTKNFPPSQSASGPE